MKRAVYFLVLLLLMAVVAFSAYKLVGGLMEYEKIDSYYEEFDTRFVTEQTPSAAPIVEAEPQPAEQSRMEEPDLNVTEHEIEAVETAPITVDFDALLQEAPDVVAWLYGMDGQINLPVVQSDDNSYYLRRLPNGEYSSGGTLFVDYNNAGDFSDEVTFIYGHNMRNGSMLEPITDYAEQACYDQYPVMYLLTPTASYKMELFSAFITDANSDVYTFGFGTAEEKTAYVSMLNQQSDFVPVEEAAAEDRILCLSTCTYEYDEARYVLFGVLTGIG